MCSVSRCAFHCLKPGDLQAEVLEPASVRLLGPPCDRQTWKNEVLVEMNRPGFPGGSKPWKGWSHGEEGVVRVRPKEPDNCIGTGSLSKVL